MTTRTRCACDSELWTVIRALNLRAIFTSDQKLPGSMLQIHCRGTKRARNRNRTATNPSQVDAHSYALERNSELVAGVKGMAARKLDLSRVCIRSVSVPGSLRT